MNSIAPCADSMPAIVQKGIKSGALVSLQTITAYVEPSLAQAKADDKFRFEWNGYFAADRVDHEDGKVVFKKITSVKGYFGKII
jgi:hypothetical protein